MGFWCRPPLSDSVASHAGFPFCFAPHAGPFVPTPVTSGHRLTLLAQTDPHSRKGDKAEEATFFTEKAEAFPGTVTSTFCSCLAGQKRLPERWPLPAGDVGNDRCLTFSAPRVEAGEENKGLRMDFCLLSSNACSGGAIKSNAGYLY